MILQSGWTRSVAWSLILFNLLIQACKSYLVPNHRNTHVFFQGMRVSEKNIKVNRSPRWLPRPTTVKNFCEGQQLHASSAYLETLSNSEDNESSSAQPRSVEADEEDLSVRPAWAPDWVPTWAVTLSPVKQVLIVIVAYAIHLGVLCRTSIVFPFQLIPNQDGLFQSLGLDSIAGIVSLVLFYRTVGKNRQRQLLSMQGPWKVSQKNQNKMKVLVTTIVLSLAYISSGYGAVIWENFLYVLASVGIPITTPMHRSLQVLLAHLSWVFMGIGILGNTFQPFFSKKTKWMKVKWRSLWVWWALGGYFVSAFFFNICDVANQFILPSSAFEVETVVSKMINPENNDVLAMAVGSIAPCMSAPWWEEVLYRGYILPGLTTFFPQKWAVPISAVLFAAHHMNLAGMIPLTVLGLLWAIIYVHSQNLIVTMIIHAMWNSRVFLGSYLGV